MLPYLSSVLHMVRLMSSVLHYSTASHTPQALPSTCSCYPSVSLLRSYRWYWNLNQLSIAYDFRPRLRSRLTLSGRTFLRNPWIFGGQDSHLPLATHANILPSVQSTDPYESASARTECSPTNWYYQFRGFGNTFQPRDIFGAPSLDQ